MEKKIISEINYGKVRVVENAAYQWAVIDDQDNIIVPFCKYGWIDGFDSGLARVRSRSVGECFRDAVVEHFNLSDANSSGVICRGRGDIKWGIINEQGEEVLPVVYDNIWNFLGKNRFSTKVEKDGVESEVYFHKLNPALPQRKINSSGRYYGYSSSRRYGEYAGSYAQDVMGYSDDVINDAFDGDPDAYWNID